MTTIANIDGFGWLCILAAWVLISCLLAPKVGRGLKRTTAPDVGLSVLDEQYDTLPIECLPRVEQVRRLEAWL